MDASSSMSKRPPDPTTTMTRESIAKRRHLPTEYSVFRLLCPATKTASLAGHIRRVQVLTNTKIHINSLSSSSDEDCVIHIVSDEDGIGTTVSAEEEAGSSPAQRALLRIFERMVRENGDEEQKDKEKEGEGEGDSFNGDGVCCRLLAESNQVGCVLGRGGKIVEKIRHQSGAQVRVFPEDHLPPWASPTDELIQITGTFSAVKKALLSVSSCLLDNPKVDAVDSGSTRPSLAVLRGISVPSHVDCYPQDSYASSLHAPDYHLRDYSSVPGPENIGNNHRMVLEEEVVFKLLCQQEKVGSLIGKGGCIIRALQNETGALIKIADATPDSDERVVVISARENFNQKHSSAQEAVIRVHCRIAEIGFEPGAAVVARLLVHPQQTGCLLGKGGFIINEMRRSTGASIRIFPKEQVLKFGSPNDVVQVIGSLQSVQDALFHITSRLRETIFPMKILPPNLSAPPYFSPFPEIPSMFRSRHAPASPGNYASPVAHPHGYDRSAFPLQSIEHHLPTFSQGMGHNCPTNMDRVPHSDRNERPGHGHFFDQPSSPRSWTLQAVGRGNHWGTADVLGSASKIGPVGSGNQLSVLSYTNTEIRIPQILLRHVRGENNSNLTQIQQTSGAKVLINDAEPGTTEGVVIVSGTPGQTHAAQSLIQAFIFCGQTAPST